MAVLTRQKQPAEAYGQSTELRGKEDGGEEALLRRLTRWFEESEEASRDARQKAERDQDYYDNKQLTNEEIEKLKQRGQPPVPDPTGIRRGYARWLPFRPARAVRPSGATVECTSW